MTIHQARHKKDKKGSSYKDDLDTLARSFGECSPESVYFFDGSDHIKIGYTGNGNLASRLATHRNEGRVLLAILPATNQDEQALHSYFSALRLPERGKETYRKDSVIYEYIDWLLRRKYARSDERLLIELDYISFSVWHPSNAQAPLVENNQMTFLDHADPRERIALRSTFSGELNSIGDEWSTPQEWIERARAAMGSIDCDPASCGPYNRRWIHASVYYTKDRSGLLDSAEWRGNVWLNPPYGRGDESAGKFIEKLRKQYDSGAITQSVTCLNLQSMSSRWFAPLREIASAHAICNYRIDFVPKPGARATSPTKGTVFSYVGGNFEKFADEFSSTCMVVRKMR